MNRMKAEYFSPLLLIALDVGAASVYAFSGDIKMAVYWVAAAVLNVCVTLAIAAIALFIILIGSETVCV